MELITEIQKTWDEMKSTLEAQKKAGTETAESKEKLAKIESSMEKLEKQLESIQAKAQRPEFIPGLTEPMDEKAKKEAQFKKQAYFKYLAALGKIEALTPEEAKTMVLADETSLGYLAPSEFMADILKNIVEFSPIRQLATVRTITSRSIKRPKRTTTTSASWVGETGLPSQTSKKHGLIEIPAHRLGALATVSEDSLQDVALLEQDLKDEFTEQFAVSEGAAYVSGNGVEKPFGLLSDSTVEVVTTAVKNQTSFDDLMDLEGSLKEFYRPNAAFLMNRLVLKHLRKIKDSNGQYIYEPAVALTVPSTILGYPYRLVTDLATSATTASNKPIIFGDFRKGYMIVDRIGMTVQTLIEAYLPNVGYWATKRTGGQVVLPEAIKILQVKA